MAKLSVEGQYEYLRSCAAATDFVINSKKSPKAEFTRLALHHLGWAPAGDEWCKNWKMCFDEEYVWRGRTTNNALSITPREPSPSPSLNSQISGSSTSSSNSSDRESSGVVSSSRDSPVPPNEHRRPGRTLETWQKLCVEVGAPISTTSKGCKQALIDGVAQHFDETYGTNYKDLEAWQHFCADVGIEPIPESIKKCKKALKKVFINIFDFIAVQKRLKPAPPRRFRAVHELAHYSIESIKIYPLELAKKETFHRALLQVLF